MSDIIWHISSLNVSGLFMDRAKILTTLVVIDWLVLQFNKIDDVTCLTTFLLN